MNMFDRKRLLIYNSSKFISFVAFFVLFSPPAHAYLVTIDQFVLVKNQFNGVGGNAVYLNDTFSDNVPPPSSEAAYPNGNIPGYLTRGAWLESGGRAIADSTNAPFYLPDTDNVFSQTALNAHTSRFATNTTPGSLFGLRDDDSFEVRGLFDLSSTLDDASTRSHYVIELADYYEDTARLGIVKDSIGNSTIQFFDSEYSTGTTTILDQDTLLAGHSQILFILTRAGAGAAVTASYAYVDGATDIADPDAVANLNLISMSGSVELFTAVDSTRAGFHVVERFPLPVPAPPAIVLFCLGLAGLGFSRFKRTI